MCRMLVLAAAMALSMSAGAADRVLLHLVHEYVDFVDRGSIDAHIRTWPAESRFGCLIAHSDVRSGNRILLTWTGRDTEPYPENCDRQHRIGTLSAGTYEVTARVLRPDGTLFAQSTQTLTVAPFGARCNPVPGWESNFQRVTAYPKGPQGVDNFAARLNTDPNFAAAIGNPTTILIQLYATDENGNEYSYPVVVLEYPPLFNLPATMEQIAVAFPWTIIDQYGGGNCTAFVGGSTIKTNIEYFHSALDHYFYANDEKEIASLDAYAASSGWRRTGKSFNVETAPNCTDGQTAVYRFWGIPGVGPNSHFFTRDPAECSIVDKSAVWSFEKVAFWASQPNADGTCNPLQYLGQSRIPLYRAWRPFGDSSHRLSTDRAVINEMVAKGWVDEGAVMCVLPPG